MEGHDKDDRQLQLYKQQIGTAPSEESKDDSNFQDLWNIAKILSHLSVGVPSNKLSLAGMGTIRGCHNGGACRLWHPIL